MWLQAPTAGSVARACVRSRADVADIERVALSDLLPAWTIHGMLQINAAITPDKTAIVALDREDPRKISRRISYAELLSLVQAAANRLHAVSRGAPPVISILTPLVPEAFVAAWAGAAAGIANPINPFLRTDHVARIMNAAGTTVLVCGGGACDQINELRSRVPTLRAVWVVDESADIDSFWKEIAAEVDAPLAFELQSDATRTSALFHTGGTTAAPKLVRHTQLGQLFNAWCCGAWSNSRSDAVVAIGMPYFHVGGAICCAVRTIVFGQTMVLVGPEGFRSPRIIASYWDLIDAHGVTNSLSTPTTAAALVSTCRGQRAPKEYAHSSGGSAVPVRVAQEFEEKFGKPLHELWGMTELHGALIGNPEAVPPHLGSIGMIFPYHRAKCVAVSNATAEQHLAADTVGLLAVSGPCVTAGYLDVARSGELFLDTEGAQRWLSTGDLGKIDAEGYVSLHGRAKDLIIRGGHNIDPVLIESELLAHPAVLHAAAVGEPDPEKGEIPVAYVELRPEKAATDAELLAHCRGEISERAAMPRVVRIIQCMPLTAVGKIFKPQLRVDAIERCVRNVMAAVGACEGIEMEVRDCGSGLCVVLRSPDDRQDRILEQIRRALERYTFRVEVESSAPK